MKKHRSEWDDPQNIGTVIGSVLSAPGALAGGLIGHALDDEHAPLNYDRLIGGTIGGTIGPLTAAGGIGVGHALHKWRTKNKGK